MARSRDTIGYSFPEHRVDVVVRDRPPEGCVSESADTQPWRAALDSTRTVPRWAAPYVGELHMVAHHRGEPGMRGCEVAERLTREAVESL